MVDTPVIEDVDDPADVAANVRIDINPPTIPAADTDELAGRMAAMLSAHSSEVQRLQDRVTMLEALHLADAMTAAAAAASEAAASAAQSAADAAKLVQSSEAAVQCAADAMAATREVMKSLSSDDAIPALLNEHCVNAATSARDVVLSCLDDAREDAREFVEEAREHAERRAADTTASGRRGKKK